MREPTEQEYQEQLKEEAAYEQQAREAGLKAAYKDGPFECSNCGDEMHWGHRTMLECQHCGRQWWAEELEPGPTPDCPDGPEG